MIEIFKTVNRKLEPSTIDTTDTWISLTNPTMDEIQSISKKFGVIEDFLLAALDPEEVSRLEVDEDQVLIIASTSHEEATDNEHLTYVTLPVAIIMIPNHIITVSLEHVNCLEFFKKRSVRELNTSKKTKFTLQIIYQIATQYLVDLRKLDILTEQIESYLHEDMENDYLIALLAVEKNLVYFSTSLKRNENLVKKITRSNVITQYEDDEDLLLDTLIEIQQASEMAFINSQIIRSIREAFGAIISNNLNTIMKILASLTIILTIPTMVFSLYGMNTSFGKMQNWPYATATILIFTLIITFIVFRLMKNRNMF